MAMMDKQIIMRCHILMPLCTNHYNFASRAPSCRKIRFCFSPQAHHCATLPCHRGTIFSVTCFRNFFNNRGMLLPINRGTIYPEHDFKLTLTILHLEFKLVMMPIQSSTIIAALSLASHFTM
jgi:hypothetical protein